MAEVYPSDATLNALTTDTDTGVQFITTGEAPYYLSFRKLLYRLLLASKAANQLRVFDEGSLDVGVKAGKFWNGTTLRTYAGSASNTLADDKAAIYIYINSAGTLVTNEYTAYPAATANHVRLATVTTSGGDITAIVDDRGHNMFSMPGAVLAESANATGKSCAVQANATGGMTALLRATLTAGVGAVSGAAAEPIHASNAPYAYRVIDAWSVALGTDQGTWKITDGTDDITDAVAVSASDKTINRAGTIDDAKHEIAASGSLSVVGDGSLADVEVYILIMRV